MTSTDEFLRKLENVMVLNFFLISLVWYFLRFDVLKVARIYFPRIIQYVIEGMAFTVLS